MTDLLKQVKIKDTEDINVLILKGMYKIPRSVSDVRDQLRFNKQVKKIRDGNRKNS